MTSVETGQSTAMIPQSVYQEPDMFLSLQNDLVESTKAMMPG